MEWEDSSGLHPNVAKFLGFLGKAEGADYNTIVGGSSFSDFSKHPEVVGLRTKEGPSTAAGRYQITKTTYKDTAPALGITDFSQKSQDLIATELIRRKNALDDVVNGDFDAAINKLGGVWASLPSSPYSQPKRDWNFVKANLTGGGGGGWEDAPRAASSGDGWEDAPAPTQAVQSAAPQAAPQPASAKAPAPTAPKRTAAESFGLGTRNVLEGVEQAFTYPVRAVGEAASGIAGLLGKKELADTISRTVGMKNKGAGALLADTAGLAKPETKTEKVIAEGTKAAAGLLSGSVVNKLAEKSPEAVKGVLNMIMPGTSGTAGQVAKDVGIYGTLGASLEAAPAETAAGLALLAGGKAAAGKVMTNRAGDKIISKAGTNEGARLDAEIITDIKKIADSSTKRGNPVSTIDLNAVEGKYINEVNRAVASLSKVDKKFDAAPLKAALQDRRALTPDDLAPLRTSKAGEAVADAIEKAQRARSLTQAMQSSGGLMPLLREGVDFLPIPLAVNRGLKAALGGRQTREVAAQKVLKQADAAENVLQRLGPSQATQSIQGLNTTVEKALASRQAQAEAAKQAAQAKAAQDATTKLQVLKDTRRPLSGAFQELLPGGASNLNLSSKEAIDALRLVSRQQKDGPVGTAAMEILRSGNVGNKDAFYGLQNQLRKLQEQGVLAGQPGALTAASSGVRNPVSYAEAVRTAGEAANLARASAPTKELAQFATKVAGIKSPADKAKAVADRLAKSNDPAEQAFLTQFVEPLAQFGKK